MLAYLQKLLEGSDAFTVDVHYNNHCVDKRCGLYSLDGVGLAVECNNEDRLIPWHAVAYVTVEITG